MTGTERSGSDGIDETAARILDLTRRIASTIDDANDLVDERQHLLLEMLRNTGGHVTILPTIVLSASIVVREIALLVVALSGPSGLTVAEIGDHIAMRMDQRFQRQELEDALSRLAAAGMIDVRRGRWRLVSDRHRTRGPSRQRRPLVKTMILDVLAKAGQPLGVAAIRDAISRDYGREIDRTTISPALALLRADGAVHHVGKAWRLSTKG